MIEWNELEGMMVGDIPTRRPGFYCEYRIAHNYQGGWVWQYVFVTWDEDGSDTESIVRCSEIPVATREEAIQAATEDFTKNVH